MLHEGSNQNMAIISPLWGPRDILGKGVEKMYKSENRGESLEHCLWVRTRQSSHDLTAAVTAYSVPYPKSFI